jgi:hypothetical protein
LIHKAPQQIARFLCRPLHRAHHLSRLPLDNPVDKSGQALYDEAKSLIFKAPLCTACFCSTLGTAFAASAAGLL